MSTWKCNECGLINSLTSKHCQACFSVVPSGLVIFIGSLKEYRFPISLAIAKAAFSWLDKEDQSLFSSDLGILIAQYMGYNDFINYKYGYPPNHKLFDTRDIICVKYGYLSGQRVQTPEGAATVIGVAPLPPEYDYINQSISNIITPNELYFDLDSDENNKNRRKVWINYRKQEFINNGFILLNNGCRINIWGQSFHSFIGKLWWNNIKYLNDTKIEYFNKFGDPDDPRFNSLKYKKNTKKINKKIIKNNADKKQNDDNNQSIIGLDDDHDDD